jgi:hypothetical protein
MKKLDIVLLLILAIIIMSIARYLFTMKIIVKIIAGLFVLCLFLYKQIKPHKRALFPQYVKWFSYIEYCFDNILKVFPLKPVKIGNSLSIDISLFILLIILNIVLIL